MTHSTLFALLLCLAAPTLTNAQIDTKTDAHVETKSDPIDAYRALVNATQLDREGQPPFHIRMNAQLYDLNGKTH